MTLLNPYISFKNTARDALTFYQNVLGGKLTLTTFEEGGMSQGPESDGLIMHGMLVSPGGLTVMGSDTPPGMEYKPAQGVSISLSGEDEAELRGYWDKLAAGGAVVMPLDKAPWGDYFGMLVDKFGVSWMVNMNAKKV